MKKLILIIALIMAISSCSMQEEKPTDTNSWSTENKVASSSWNVKETEDKKTEADLWVKTLVDFCKKMWIKDCKTEETKFSWKIENSEIVELDWYKFNEKKYNWDSYTLAEDLFKGWEMSNSNMSDWPSMFSYGYTKDNLICKIDSELSKEKTENEKELYNIVIYCSVKEKKEKDLWTEVWNLQLEAHSEDPTWSLVINKKELVYDSPKNYPERWKVFEVKTYVKKWIINFEGKSENDTISWTFLKQDCILNDKKHSYLVEIKLNSEKLSTCWDDFEVEYNENYDDSIEK